VPASGASRLAAPSAAESLAASQACCSPSPLFASASLLALMFVLTLLFASIKLVAAEHTNPRQPMEALGWLCAAEMGASWSEPPAGHWRRHQASVAFGWPARLGALVWLVWWAGKS